MYIGVAGFFFRLEVKSRVVFIENFCQEVKQGESGLTWSQIFKRGYPRGEVKDNGRK